MSNQKTEMSELSVFSLDIPVIESSTKGTAKFLVTQKKYTLRRNPCVSPNWKLILKKVEQNTYIILVGCFLPSNSNHTVFIFGSNRQNCNRLFCWGAEPGAEAAGQQEQCPGWLVAQSHGRRTRRAEQHIWGQSVNMLGQNTKVHKHWGRCGVKQAHISEVRCQARTKGNCPA